MDMRAAIKEYRRGPEPKLVTEETPGSARNAEHTVQRLPAPSISLNRKSQRDPFRGFGSFPLHSFGQAIHVQHVLRLERLFRPFQTWGEFHTDEIADLAINAVPNQS